MTDDDLKLRPDAGNVGLEHGELEPPCGENTKLEPLGVYRASRGISSAMKAVFDVLYDANEPLDLDTIVDRTFNRVVPAVHYHARRALIRERERGRRYSEAPRRAVASGTANIARDRRKATSGGGTEVSLKDAWRWYLARTMRFAARRPGSLRREDGRYSPNPLKPPMVMQPDGRRVKYTREVWAHTSERDRAIGDIQVMRMEIDRVLESADLGRLDDHLMTALRKFAGRNRSLRWIVERPTTDAAKAWLLGEFIRRRYGSPPDM